MDNYTILLNKLDTFIRKYYLNQIIKGVLLSVGLVLCLFLLVNILEYNFYFKSTFRKVMFFGFLGSSALAIGYWVIYPMLQYFRLGKTINNYQAADIIGKHFADVKDKLLNILQLKDQMTSQPSDLLLASIDQKSESIKLVPFKSAIDLSKNKKHLKYAIPPTFLFLSLLVSSPNILKDGTERLINNNKEYERPAPFTFISDKDKFNVIQFSDYPVRVKLEGDKIPKEVYINIEGYQYKMTSIGATEFEYTFRNVQKGRKFNFTSSGFDSKTHELNVLFKPTILDMKLDLKYPSYLNKKSEQIDNIGDILVPQGTNISWKFKTQHTDRIDFLFSNKEKFEEAAKKGNNDHTLSTRAIEDCNYQIFYKNNVIGTPDSIQYSISVIPDEHPSIQVETIVDSSNLDVSLFIGDVADDYGISRLELKYQIKNSAGVLGALNSKPISIPTERQSDFQYQFNIEDFKLTTGEELVYYFEVFDNDAINGSKSAKTETFYVNNPSIAEIKEETKENNAAIKNDLKEAIEESLKIQEEFKKLKNKLLQKKEIDWQTKKEMEELMKRQEELEKRIEDAKQKMKDNQENQEKLNQNSPELDQKQEQLEKLMDEVVNEEMQQLMEQIQELMEKMEKDEALEMMEQMETSDEKMNMDLERMMELFKKLEFEQQLEENIEALEEMAEEQEKLAQESKQDETTPEEIEEKQKELNEKFEELKKEMEELKEKNEELEKPQDMEDPKEEMEDIEQDMQESQEQLGQKQKSKAAQKQKKAAEKMKKMAGDMKQQQQNGEMEQLDIDMEALRQILENLVSLSFEQEDLINDLDVTAINTPKYIENVQNQHKIKEDFKIVEDSLFSLSKRVYQIEAFVTEKVYDTKTDVKNSIKSLEERNKNIAAKDQQSAMKNLNDLALMLNDVMDQMQQQMSQMMSGSQMCNNPKPGQGGPKSKMSGKQKSLTESMKKMHEKMKKDAQGGKGGQGMSKEFAEMAAKQAELRRALEKMKEGRTEQGKSGKELQEIIDQMDKIEEDLVNKKLDNEMLKRQQGITTKMLEFEKADKQREMDEKREAETAQNIEKKLPPEIEEYLKKRNAEIEQLKYISPELLPFYKFLVEEYQRDLKKNQ